MNPLTNRQEEILKELVNIGAGRGADVLNSFLGSHIVLSVPEVGVLGPKELGRVLSGDIPSDLASVKMDFSGSVSGAAELIFVSDEAARFVELITGEEDTGHDFDTLKAAAFSEVGNIVINAVLGTISNELSLVLDFSVPDYVEGTADELICLLDADHTSVVLYARVLFFVEEIELQGSIAIFFTLHSFENLLEAVEHYV